MNSSKKLKRKRLAKKSLFKNMQLSNTKQKKIVSNVVDRLFYPSQTMKHADKRKVAAVKSLRSSALVSLTFLTNRHFRTNRELGLLQNIA